MRARELATVSFRYRKDGMNAVFCRARYIREIEFLPSRGKFFKTRNEATRSLPLFFFLFSLFSFFFILLFILFDFVFYIFVFAVPPASMCAIKYHISLRPFLRGANNTALIEF